MEAVHCASPSSTGRTGLGCAGGTCLLGAGDRGPAVVIERDQPELGEVEIMKIPRSRALDTPSGLNPEENVNGLDV